MTHIAHDLQAVEIADEFTAQLQAGMAIAAAFYANGRRTLVASLTMSEAAEWDGSRELALVSDLDGIDLPDESDLNQAA